MKPSFLVLATALVSAAALAAPSCLPADGTVDAYLLVSPAARQPASVALGTVVVVQQRGGAALRLSAQGGTYQLIGDAPGDAGRATSCTSMIKDDVLYFIDVLPTGGECLLRAELLAASTGSDPCGGEVLDTKIVPVTTTRANPATTTTTTTSSTTTTSTSTTSTSTAGAGGGDGGSKQGTGGADGGSTSSGSGSGGG